MHPIREIEQLIHHRPEGDAMTEQTSEAPKTAVEDAEEHVRQMIAWGQRFIDKALPAVTSAAARADDLAEKLAQYEANPAVQIIAKAVLDPERAAQLADVLAGMVKMFGAVEHEAEEHEPAPPAEPEAPAEPESPSAPIVAGGQPQ